MPSPESPVTAASPHSVTFYSAYNSAVANSDGSGVAAVRPTRIRLDEATAQSAPWNPACRTLYWERDMNSNGSFGDSVDRSVVLARNIANLLVADATNGTSYTPVFRYAYRSGGTVQWTDNASSSLDLSTIVGIRVRIIVDTKMGGVPKYIDATTTVRLRNASSDYEEDHAQAHEPERSRAHPAPGHHGRAGHPRVHPRTFVIMNQQRATATMRSEKQSLLRGRRST